MADTPTVESRAQPLLSAEFYDRPSAERWLIDQPLANTETMLDRLAEQLPRFLAMPIATSDRFKALEVLRKPIFTFCRDALKRVENKPLPLLAAEQSCVLQIAAIWRLCRQGYQEALGACLALNAGFVRHSALIVSRVLACMRMEQLCCYQSRMSLPKGFWYALHDVFVAAERLGVVRDLVEDKLLGETKQASAVGQYAMALMLHLAQPARLSRTELTSVIRWLSRWRERAGVLRAPDSDGGVSLELAIAEDRPFVAANAKSPANGLVPKWWFSVGGVLRKIQQRSHLLAQGATPEALKLGTSLSDEACAHLLEQLWHRLQTNEVPHMLGGQLPPNTGREVMLGAGLEAIFATLGGKGLKRAADPMQRYGSYLQRQQIAVFGHVVEKEERPDYWERWRACELPPAAEGGNGPRAYGLLRPGSPTSGNEKVRLKLGGLVVLKEGRVEIGQVRSLVTHENGCVEAEAVPVIGDLLPVIIEIADRTSARHQRVAGLIVLALKRERLWVPEGLFAKAHSFSIVHGVSESTLAYKNVALIERAGECECWSIASS